MEFVKCYELEPRNGRKSFYGKAKVYIDKDNNEYLYSYGTPVICWKDGKFHRLWNDWTSTTGNHIKSFCGMNKQEFLKLEYEGD